MDNLLDHTVEVSQSADVMLIWPYGMQGQEAIPMFLAFLVPQIAKHFSVSFVDATLSNLSPDSLRFAEIVGRAKPRVVGISSWSQNWTQAQHTIRAVRETLPDAKIVLGGPHITATGTWDAADYAVLGEAEHVFAELAKRLIDGDDVSDLPGVIGPGVGSKPPNLIADLDGLGLPDYSAMLLHLYQDTAGCKRSLAIGGACVRSASSAAPAACSARWETLYPRRRCRSGTGGSKR